MAIKNQRSVLNSQRKDVYSHIVKNQNIMSQKTSDLYTYSKSIKILADTESDLIFKNSNHNHAQIVLSNLIRTSNKSVYIYDDNLFGDVANSSETKGYLITAITEFIRSEKGLLKIVVDELGLANNFQEKLIKLQKKHPKYIEIKIANNEFKKDVNKNFNNKNLNFAVGDSSKFRVEYDEKKQRKAFCSFNDSSYTKKLTNLFESNYKNCIDV